MTTLFAQNNSRVINLRVGDDSLVFMIKKFLLNVFPILNTDRLMTAYDLGKDGWRDMGNKSNSCLINAAFKLTLHEIALYLHGPVLKAGFRKSHPQPKRISLFRCKQRALLVATAADCFWRRVPTQNTTKQSVSRPNFHAVYHFFHPSPERKIQQS